MARPRKTAAPAEAGTVMSDENQHLPANPEAFDVTEREPAAPAKLKDFIAHHEQAAQDAGVVVASITHPDAEPGVRQGKYSGIRMLEGEPSARYSDGTTH